MSKKVYQVIVNVLNTNENFVGAPLYLVGTFNNWSARHLPIGEIPAVGERMHFLLPAVEAGDLELKLSRGDYRTLTANQDGKLEDPQIFKIQKDTEVTLTIENWRDLYPASTASPQVHVLDEHFFFPELDVFRKVSIYLPKDYAGSEKRYPVLYMHDGQHLFDEATSLGRSGPVEWKVDETIDSSGSSVIVVAIDHATDYEVRQQEYLVNSGKGTPDPKGWKYLHDIVHTLKPHVDLKYRTLAGVQHTTMLGSSLGGLLTLYAGLAYPQVFGTAAIFSPSIWMDEENLYRYAAEKLGMEVDRKEQEFYFYIGDRERRFRMMDAKNNMRLDMDRFYTWFAEHFSGKLTLDVNPEGKHGAQFWQTAFQQFYAHWIGTINSSN